MEGEAGTQVDDAQKDKEIARNTKAEKEKKREATFEMTTTKKEAPEKGKVSFCINKVTSQGSSKFCQLLTSTDWYLYSSAWL